MGDGSSLLCINFIINICVLCLKMNSSIKVILEKINDTTFNFKFLNMKEYIYIYIYIFFFMELANSIKLIPIL